MLIETQLTVFFIKVKKLKMYIFAFVNKCLVSRKARAIIHFILKYMYVEFHLKWIGSVKNLSICIG